MEVVSLMVFRAKVEKIVIVYIAAVARSPRRKIAHESTNRRPEDDGFGFD